MEQLLSSSLQLDKQQVHELVVAAENKEFILNCKAQ